MAKFCVVAANALDEIRICFCDQLKKSRFSFLYGISRPLKKPSNILSAPFIDDRGDFGRFSRDLIRGSSCDFLYEKAKLNKMTILLMIPLSSVVRLVLAT